MTQPLRLKDRPVPATYEKAVQEQVVRLFMLAGCQVARLSQPRRTMQTLGLPDLWIFGPGECFCWFEVKRPGGRLRPEQRVFRERCQDRKIEHVVGGMEEAERLLVGWRLAEPLPSGGVMLTPKRATR